MRAYEIAAAVAGMVALSAPAWSQGGGRAADLTVYVTGAGLLSGSENRVFRGAVDRMLARAGVRITWINGKPKSGGGADAAVLVHIRFVQQAINGHSPGALACATPFAGGMKTITVFCDRIRMIAWRGSARETHIVAHVLAHELGHVLKCTTAHADTGVMKAHLDREDFEAMKKKPLEYTSSCSS